jgi:hypothetical protein
MTDDASVDPLDEEDTLSLDQAAERERERDRDGVGSLRDTEAESGDEEELADTYDVDLREAREAQARLDGEDDEPRLD